MILRRGLFHVYFLVFIVKLKEITADCASQSHLEKHIGDWVNFVAYSHLTDKKWGYPTDCSGFVSWAIKGKDLKAYDYASSKYSSEIDIDDLKFGDIIVHVFDKSPLKRCEKKDKVTFINDTPSYLLVNETVSLSSESQLEGISAPWDYLSGHVFFFDKWDDSKKENFWAYESSETQDQTKECLSQTNEFTRSKCLNHHVLKSRKVIEKYSKDTCKDPKYNGTLKGGPRRLSGDLLCQD